MFASTAIVNSAGSHVLGRIYTVGYDRQLRMWDTDGQLLWDADVPEAAGVSIEAVGSGFAPGRWRGTCRSETHLLSSPRSLLTTLWIVGG